MNKRQRKKRIRFKVGSIYLDCAGHPVLCTEAEREWRGQGLWGISLLDGSAPRGCSLRHCNPEHVTPAEASAIKLHVERNYRRDERGCYGQIALPYELYPKHRKRR
jgi:hypothetical protein